MPKLTIQSCLLLMPSVPNYHFEPQMPNNSVFTFSFQYIYQFLIMAFQYDSPKNHHNIDQITIEKVSSLITRFHAVLLPKANKTGIFRDLSEEE